MLVPGCQRVGFEFLFFSPPGDRLRDRRKLQHDGNRLLLLHSEHGGFQGSAMADAACTPSASTCRTQRYVMIEHGKRSQRWVSFGIPYVKFMLKLGQQWYISDG